MHRLFYQPINKTSLNETHSPTPISSIHAAKQIWIDCKCQTRESFSAPLQI